MFNTDPNEHLYDSDFYDNVIRMKRDLELDQSLHNDDLWYNTDFSFDEVRRVINKAKSNKSVGVDNIPNEAFRNEQSIVYLHALFNKMFSTGRIPSLWRIAILKPIPKSSTLDPRIPLQYRGISLLSTVGKLYTSLLNNRVVNHMDRTERYVDEQNGFRQKSSCSDHI